VRHQRTARSIALKLAATAVTLASVIGCVGAATSHDPDPSEASAGPPASKYPDPSGAPAGFADKLCAAVASIDRVDNDLHVLVLAGTDMPAIANGLATVAEHIDETDAILVAIPDWGLSGERIAEWRPLMTAESADVKKQSAAAATGSKSDFLKAIRESGKESLGFDLVDDRMREFAEGVGIECAPAPTRAPAPSPS
jgi:hypothetical protein